MIFVSGTFYNPMVGTILGEITHAMVYSVAPVLADPRTGVEKSYTNSILYAIYGAPWLVAGLILVKRYGR